MLAADQSFMLDGDPTTARLLALTEANTAGTRWPTASPGSRRASGAATTPRKAAAATVGKDRSPRSTPRDAGLVTFTPDDLDWDDEVRLMLEERASFSPDALTGMEANLRFVGPETMETKIFARLTAWQNWIFQRPNASGRTARCAATAPARGPTYDRKPSLRSR